MNMLYEGKAKQIFETDQEDVVLVRYKDDATAFNGEKKGSIQDKGVLNNKITSFFFHLLTERGIPNHFIKRLNDREQLVKKLTIIPLEVIVRNRIAGSLAKRLGVEEGTIAKQPILEFCYKNDELGDPFVNTSQILALGWATKEEIETIGRYALDINEILKAFLDEKNVILVDFKLEFDVHKGEIMLGDEISPDTCRFWDKDSLEKLDKDRFRRDLGHVGEAYKEMLLRLTGEQA